MDQDKRYLSMVNVKIVRIILKQIHQIIPGVKRNHVILGIMNSLPKMPNANNVIYLQRYQVMAHLVYQNNALVIQNCDKMEIVKSAQILRK